MKKNAYLSAHIYFAVSVISAVFLMFANTNLLFGIAYEPMTPSYLGGKITYAAVYTAAAVILYILSLFGKKIPVYPIFALLFLFEIFNYISPVFSSRYAEEFLSSLIKSDGNLALTVKAAVILSAIIFAAIVFSSKNRAVKTVFRILAVLFAAAFIVFEFITFASLDPADTVNFSEKAAKSLFFDFLRFTPVAALSFLPVKKNAL